MSLMRVETFGGSDNISGFTLSSRGHLTALANSTRPLSAELTQPAQIGFNRAGTALVVTEKKTNIIDTYVVQRNGLTVGPTVHRSSAATPFGFAFDNRDHAIISDAAGGGQNASGASSYELIARNGLRPITPFSPTNQTAACWVAISIDGMIAFVSNTASGTISGFRVGVNGALTPLNNGHPLAATGLPISGPTDMAQSPDGRFLFVLDAAVGAVSVFAELPSEQLVGQLGVYGLPSNSSGLAAR